MEAASSFEKLVNIKHSSPSSCVILYETTVSLLYLLFLCAIDYLAYTISPDVGKAERGGETLPHPARVSGYDFR
jgi:hypothetical protein